MPQIQLEAWNSEFLSWSNRYERTDWDKKKGCSTSYKSQQCGLSKIIGFHDPLPRYDLTGRPDNIGKREMNNDFSQKYYICSKGHPR